MSASVASSLVDLATRFPLETVTLPIGDRDWRITCVTDQDALLDGVNEVEHVPYGFLLWESAVALAAWLAEDPQAVTGKPVLELGAGVGLAGLMAQHLGAELWQTDHRADVLQLAQENARQNGVALPQQFVADWRNWTHAAQYELILGADILYERAMHRHLAPIFHANLAPGGALLLSDPSRPQALELIAKLEDEGWWVDIEMRTVTLPLPGRTNKAVDVAILVCRH
ncbi:MAG: 50S ribosomal protein L11 methyltransferase [Caldilineaceae bacterium]|nr:50S ribosomal protein L11 methyltransferase [Caldilineaceae bacterium]